MPHGGFGSSTSRDVKVVVIGGGLGGLSAGLALSRAGFDVSLYERAPQITPIGAGISLWPNGVKVMTRLGVADDLERLAPQLNYMTYLAPDGAPLLEVPLDGLTQAARQRAFPVARTDIQMLLLEHFGPERVTLGATCIGVEQDDDVATVVFEDGRRVIADLVVAADGVRSVIRPHVVGAAWPPRYAGDVNWNGLTEIDEDLNPGDVFTIVVGEHKRFGMMPVSGGRIYFFFDAPLSQGAVIARGGWRQELRSLFAGWGHPVSTAIERLDEDRMVRQPLYDLAPLEQFVRGRVALLGDAAHASTPMLGQGAAQAMEDAEVLTHALMTTDTGVSGALLHYQAMRKERVHHVARESRARTELLMGVDPAATQAWYDGLRRAPGRDVVDAMAHIVASTPLA